MDPIPLIPRSVVLENALLMLAVLWGLVVGVLVAMWRGSR
jgi:hypothetical protein